MKKGDLASGILMLALGLTLLGTAAAGITLPPAVLFLLGTAELLLGAAALLRPGKKKK